MRASETLASLMAKVAALTPPPPGGTPVPQALASAASASPAPLRKPPVSAKKLAANRANAAKSTGPRTPEGKAASSGNAVVHGLSPYASLLLPGEDEAELRAFVDDVVADLGPRGAVERMLAERAAGLMWRLRRVPAAEGAMLRADDAKRWREYVTERDIRAQFGRRLPDPPAPHSAAGFLASQFMHEGRGGKATSPLERLAVYEQRLDRALHATLRQLHQLRQRRADAGPEDDVRDEKRPDPPATAGPPVSAGSGHAPAPPEGEEPPGAAQARPTAQNEPTVSPAVQAPPAFDGAVAETSVAQNEPTAGGAMNAANAPDHAETDALPRSGSDGAGGDVPSGTSRMPAT